MLLLVVFTNMEAREHSRSCSRLQGTGLCYPSARQPDCFRKRTSLEFIYACLLIPGLKMRALHLSVLAMRLYFAIKRSAVHLSILITVLWASRTCCTAGIVKKPLCVSEEEHLRPYGRCDASAKQVASDIHELPCLQTSFISNKVGRPRPHRAQSRGCRDVDVDDLAIVILCV